MKVGIYARCSKDENEQDIRNQYHKQKEWCKEYNYDYAIFQDYISAFKAPEMGLGSKNLVYRKLLR